MLAKQFLDGVRPRRDSFFITIAYQVIGWRAAKSIGDLPPGGIRPDTVPYGMTIDRIGILAVKGRHMNGRGRHEGRGKKFIDSGDALHPSGNMCKRDQRVRLTAAIVRIQAENRCYLVFLPAKTQAHIRQ